MMKRSLYIIIFLFSSLAFAQAPLVRFEPITVNEDFNQNYFLSIYKDQKGFLWLGTYSALYRYDGYNVKTFVPTDDSTTISSPVVHSIIEDKNGILWFGTETGLNRFDPKTEKFQRIYAGTSPNSLSHNFIKSMCFDEEGKLWLATYGGGLNVLDPQTGIFKSYKNNFYKKNSLANNRVNVVYVDRKGQIWAGTENGGLCLYNKDNDSFINFNYEKNNPNSLSDSIINCLLEDSRGNFWVGTWQGGLNLFNRDSKQFTHYVTSENVRALVEDNNGQLWLGLFGSGLIHFNPSNKSFSAFNSNEYDKNALSGNFVWSLYYSQPGILWVGTAGNGLCKFDEHRNRIPCYQISKKNKYSAESFFEDSKKQLWIGTDKGSVVLFDRKKAEYNFLPVGKPTNTVTILDEDINGNIWLGTNEGLYKKNEKSGSFEVQKIFFDGQIRKTAYITALRVDKNNNLWFSVYNVGLFKVNAEDLKKGELIENTTLYVYNASNFSSLSSNIIWDIYEDSQGNIWLATDKFIDRFNPVNQTFTHFGGYAYSCIYQNREDVLWVGTYGRGIARLDITKNSLEYFTKAEGLAHDIVYGISGDLSGDIWISTVKGISKYSPTTGQFSNFDATDGLQEGVFLHHSCAMLSSGELAFGGKNGFNIFSPGQTSSANVQTPVIISDIKLFNKSVLTDSFHSERVLDGNPVNISKDLFLKYSDRVFSIEFTALNLSWPEKQKYAYRLDGFDHDWIATDADNRLATYTNLDEGEYKFRVKALSADGNYSSEETSLNIIISPPWYKTWLFRIIVIILLLYLSVLSYRKRLKYLHEKFLKAQLAAEQELIKLKNEKLDNELASKNRELNTRTMDLIHKNEKIQEIKNSILHIIPNSNGQSLNELQSLLKSIKREIEDESYWDQFEYQFNLTHDNFLKRFKDTYPQLTHNDLKLCAYMRMNLQNHEIATLLNISIRAVETSRYRMRKKINLNSPVSLSEFILRF